MLDSKTRLLTRLLILLDTLLTTLVLLLSFHIGQRFLEIDASDLNSYLILCPLIVIPQAFLLSTFGAYSGFRLNSNVSYSIVLTKTLFIGIALFFAFLYALKMDFVSRGILLIFFVMNFVTLMSVRSLLSWWYTHRSDTGKDENFHKVLIIGSGKRAQKLTGLLHEHSEWKIDIVGYLDDAPVEDPEKTLAAPILGSVQDVGDVLSERVVDEVILAVPRTMIKDVQQIVNSCEEQGVRFALMADVFDLKVARTHLRDLHGVPLLTFEPVAQNEALLMVKRLSDLSITLCSMPIVLPLMAIIALAIRIESKGPALFIQQRVGLRKRLFPMYKFRSMHVDAEEKLKEIEHLNEADGPIFKITDDPRVTKVGKFIRKTSLDELPQLFNVIRGHMSLVGPRPMSMRDVDLFDRGIQRKRFSVRPGLTCIWQISGRSNLPFEKWLELDLEYIDTWSLELDFKILIKTLPAVLFSKGAV